MFFGIRYGDNHDKLILGSIKEHGNNKFNINNVDSNGYTTSKISFFPKFKKLILKRATCKFHQTVPQPHREHKDQSTVCFSARGTMSSAFLHNGVCHV